MAKRQRAFSMSDETYSKLKRITRYVSITTGIEMSDSKTVTMLINKYFEAHAAEFESFEAAEVRSDRN